MEQEMKYPQWQQLLHDAILEFDSVCLARKVRKAEAAISVRIQKLRAGSHNADELWALRDGLSIIRILKEERQSPPVLTDE